MKNLEEDVSTVILFAHGCGAGMDKEVAEVLAVCLKDHGISPVIENLWSRNQTSLIASLLDVLIAFQDEIA